MKLVLSDVLRTGAVCFELLQIQEALDLPRRTGVEARRFFACPEYQRIPSEKSYRQDVYLESKRREEEDRDGKKEVTQVGQGICEVSDTGIQENASH